MNQTMTIGKLYLVTLKGGQAHFGVLEERRHGVCWLSGLWCIFSPGAFAESAVETALELPQPRADDGETENDWLERTGWHRPPAESIQGPGRLKNAALLRYEGA